VLVHFYDLVKQPLARPDGRPDELALDGTARGFGATATWNSSR